MRGVLISLALVPALLITAPATTTTSPIPISSTISVVALQQGAPTAQPPEAQQAPSQAPDRKIDIPVDKHPAAAGWYRNPVWIAIGALAALVVLLLIVVLAKGSDTTVIRN